MKDITKNLINDIKVYNKESGCKKAIIGISGGKDSFIVAALSKESLGAENVIGVLIPNGEQKDLDDSKAVCNFLGINYIIVNIGQTYETLMHSLPDKRTGNPYLNPMITTNLPARLRMAVLYSIAAGYTGARVINTCNRSEDYVGYSTKFGDAAGDVSYLAQFTVREVLEIGDDLGLPYELVHKAPSDGMCGKTDEDNLGFTYAELDTYLLEGVEPDAEKLANIEKRHKASLHKLQPMPSFSPRYSRYSKDNK